MKVKCPICQKDGSMQQRHNSIRVGHYSGVKGKTRIIEWHATTIKDVLTVNRDLGIMVNNQGKLVCLPTFDHCLPSKRQIMSLAP